MLQKSAHRWKRSLKALTRGQAAILAEHGQMHRRLTEKSFIRRTKEHQCGDYVQVEVFDTMDYDLLAEEVEEA